MHKHRKNSEPICFFYLVREMKSLHLLMVLVKNFRSAHFSKSSISVSQFFTHTLNLSRSFKWLKIHRPTNENVQRKKKKEKKKLCVGAVICCVESICYRFICASFVPLLKLPLLNTFHSCNPICYSTPIIEVSA